VIRGRLLGSAALPLAEMHRALIADGTATMVLTGSTGPENTGPENTGVDTHSRLGQTGHDVLVGAGFAIEDLTPDPLGTEFAAGLTRQWTLPDTVATHMRVLVCGLNPSPAAADSGVGFARPGNRFWPAAQAAGLVTVDRDPRHALTQHGVGMTDLVKRTTRRADELDRDEYVEGTERVRRLVERLRPEVVCFVGLSGWRAAIDRRAVAGWQTSTFGDRPTYVMPSTSGLNAHETVQTLTAHLRSVVEDTDRSS